MKKTIFSVTLAAFILALVLPASAATLREDLVAMKSPKSVVAVTNTMTQVIIGDWGSKAFKKEFSAYLAKFELEVKAAEKHPVTGTITEKWIQISPDAKGKYKHPVTGKMTWVVHHKSSSLRVVGLANIRVIYNGSALRLVNIKHLQPQPLAFKVYKNKPNHFKTDNLDDMGYEKLYQYLAAKEVDKADSHKWVIKKGSQLIQASDLDAYFYISGTETKHAQWYLEISGANSKVIKSTGFERTVIPNETLKGLAYTPLKPGNMGPVTAAGSNISEAERNLALALASSQSNITARKNPNEVFNGIYHGPDGAGAVRVTVRTLFSPKGGSDKERLLDSNTYLVKNGVVTKIKSDTIADAILPDEVEQLIVSVAQDTQKRGSSAAMYQDYVVTGKPLRDERQCDVEVSVFKGGASVTTRILDGCKQ